MESSFSPREIVSELDKCHNWSKKCKEGSSCGIEKSMEKKATS